MAPVFSTKGGSMVSPSVSNCTGAWKVTAGLKISSVRRARFHPTFCTARSVWEEITADDPEPWMTGMLTAAKAWNEYRRMV
jgi:hypothetical protein